MALQWGFDAWCLLQVMLQLSKLCQVCADAESQTQACMEGNEW